MNRMKRPTSINSFLYITVSDSIEQFCSHVSNKDG